MIKLFCYRLIFVVWTLSVCTLSLPFVFLPQRYSFLVTTTWAKGVVFYSRVFFDISWEIRGEENIPQEACLVACNHQSLWETCVLYLPLRRPLYVFKKELAFNPLFSWYLYKLGCISVDRKGGTAALKKFTKETLAALKQDRQIIIFPEGTRVPPGTHGKYQAGIASVYTQANVKVLPVAHNAGMCVPKKGKISSGKIIMEFLPPIEPGMKRKPFMDELEKTITTAVDRIYAEANAEKIETTQQDMR